MNTPARSIEQVVETPKCKNCLLITTHDIKLAINANLETVLNDVQSILDEKWLINIFSLNQLLSSIKILEIPLKQICTWEALSKELNELKLMLHKVIIAKSKNFNLINDGSGHQLDIIKYLTQILERLSQLNKKYCCFLALENLLQ